MGTMGIFPWCCHPSRFVAATFEELHANIITTIIEFARARHFVTAGPPLWRQADRCVSSAQARTRTYGAFPWEQRVRQPTGQSIVLRTDQRPGVLTALHSVPADSL